MVGQFVSPTSMRYNVILLAGGAGSRMGTASEYIPKPLSVIGSRRAIDYIIDSYALIAGKFIIGTGFHADLLEAYVKGQYYTLPIVFSRENPSQMKNDSLSTILCLDHADTRLGTIIVFCDMLFLGHNVLKGNCIGTVDKNTNGHLGTFRHTAVIHDKYIVGCNQHNPPIKQEDINSDSPGILGWFVCENTALLKQIAYSVYGNEQDLTRDIIIPYSTKENMTSIHCTHVFDFGTLDDLSIVRQKWETV